MAVGSRRLEAFISAARRGRGAVRGEELLRQPEARTILEADVETQAALATEACEELSPDRGALGRFISMTILGARDYWVDEGLRHLIVRLLRSRLPLEEQQLVRMVHAAARTLQRPFALGGMLSAVERLVAGQGPSEELRRALEALRETLAGSHTAEHKKVGVRIGVVLGESGVEIIESGIWGDDVIAWLGGLDPEARPRWDAILEHAALASGKSRPSKRWQRQAAELVRPMTSELSIQLVGWMESAKLGWTHKHTWVGDVELGMSDQNQDLLKGLVWAAASISDGSLAHAIGSFAQRCYRKIKDFGPASQRLGNACLFTLSAMPDGIGVAHLSRLAGKVRYASGRTQVERALNTAAERAGQTREDIEELAVPDYGLDGDGLRRTGMGEFTAEVALLDGEVNLGWIKPDGKRQKSVPKPVKETHAAEVRALKKQVKEIKEQLVGQAGRLQRLYLQDRRITLAALRERYLEHPLVGQHARRLLWLVRHGESELEVMWRDGTLATLGGERVDLSDSAEARLWHIIDATGAANADDEAALQRLLVWRDHLEEQRIRQPFKQLWREVYRPSDPAAAADRRFAGHIVRQHPFLNLCQQRGWQYTIQGYWDSHNLPTKSLPRWGLMATLEVDSLDHAKDDQIFNYLMTGGLQFYSVENEEIYSTSRPVPASEVPPVVFSEVMRDVDLFVGVATVANDPGWNEAGIKKGWTAYWNDTAWGDLAPVAQTRRQVLERVLHRTTLRDRTQLEDRWLTVEGSRNSYRIHLGSANVRTSDDRPLTVVPDRKAKNHVTKVFLPFEGDSMLATILAKAFLLAEDERLTQ